MGQINKNDQNSLIDRHKIGRERAKVRKDLQNTGCRTVSNNFRFSSCSKYFWRFRFGLGSLEYHFRGSGLVQVSSSKILLVQVRFRFIDLKFNCRYSFRPEKKGEIADPVVDQHCSYCACTSASGILIWKNIFLLLLGVQVRFGFT